MSVGIDDLYRFAWRNVGKLPTRLGYGLFHAGANLTYWSNRLNRSTGGVAQLRRNLARLHPELSSRELQRMTRAGMRSYMRYFYEAFALPKLTPEQIDARVRVIEDPQLRADIAAGSIVVALPHMGNWDMVGAWASKHLATVLTVAERLKPEDLFEQFVAFREGLGMRIIGQSHGEKVFAQLLKAAGEGHYVLALLADRDLSSSGIVVPLGNGQAHIAAGPAALAVKLDLPLYVASVSYERLTGERRRQAAAPWGTVLHLVKVSEPGIQGEAEENATSSSAAEDSDTQLAARPSSSEDPTTSRAVRSERERIANWTAAWAAALEPLLTAHAVDWHMLQPVFHEDLDLERLARRHEREGESEAGAPASDSAAAAEAGTPSATASATASGAVATGTASTDTPPSEE